MQSSCYRAFDGKRVHVSGNIIGLRRRTEDVHDQNPEHLRLAVIKKDSERTIEDFSRVLDAWVRELPLIIGSKVVQ